MNAEGQADRDYWNNKSWGEYSSQLPWELDDDSLEEDDSEDEDDE
jgi:hypothetical protein